MPDVLLFGATGYTGRLTARVLADRGVDFAIAGRSRDKLEALAAETGGPGVRVAGVGDTPALVKALQDCKVLITCVGPFVELGDTAAEAAIEAGVHYVDSTGEGTFVARLLDRYDERAKAAGIVMAPCFGFDEVPGDVAVALASRGMERPSVTLTYAVPSQGSVGTIRSALRIIGSSGSRISKGSPAPWKVGQEQRWAPMPPPLGPRSTVAFPLAIGYLAPLHTDFESFETYISSGRGQRNVLKVAAPALRAAFSLPPGRALFDKALGMLPEGPEGENRDKPFTILAEASDGTTARNVSVKGRDVYGLTAEFLATAAQHLAGAESPEPGVRPPVGATGLEMLTREFDRLGLEIETYEPKSGTEVG